MNNNLYSKFQGWSFASFRQTAVDNTLSIYQKIGFPDEYRSGKEPAIFADITRKLRNLHARKQIVVDIGPGCSELPLMLINFCRQQEHTLILIDSQEMLDNLPDADHVVKLAAYYPDQCSEFLEEFAGRVNAVISYSVLHYVFAEGNIFNFLDQSLRLLASQGEILFGDIPNVSKRKRFFASETGNQFHQHFTQSIEKPIVNFNQVEPTQIDDAVLVSLLSRARLAGFDGYWLPQAPELPMSNRREDLYFVRP